jgi:hypothetical protein
VHRGAADLKPQKRFEEPYEKNGERQESEEKKSVRVIVDPIFSGIIRLLFLCQLIY